MKNVRLPRCASARARAGVRALVAEENSLSTEVHVCARTGLEHVPLETGAPTRCASACARACGPAVCDDGTSAPAEVRIRAACLHGCGCPMLLMEKVHRPKCGVVFAHTHGVALDEQTDPPRAGLLDTHTHTPYR